MGKIALKINIAGRTYPLNISENEKDKVEKAAKQINDAVEFLKKNYTVKDPQDLLAMASLQALAKSKSKSNDKADIQSNESEYIELLEKVSKEIKTLL